MASISTCLNASSKSRLLFSPPISISKPSIRLKPPDSFTPIHHLPFSRISPKISHSRVPIHSVRAGIDLPAGIRPGGAVESDKLPVDVRNRAMEAVDSYGGRVTVGDVASRAGLKLNEAQTALQALAADTDGFLEVSDEGDVLYVFPKDYRSKLVGKSFRMKIEPLVDKAKSAAEYLIRVSFGTTLIASIVIVYTTIIALLSSRSEEDNRGRRGGRSYDSGFTFYLNPTDLFWYWDPYYYRRRQVRRDDDGKMNFIESIFSFVFGDGDPNQGIEEERWKLIGQYISSNGGVVTAEELAPYLDLQTSEQALNDESYILPVLLRFDGQPEIDEEGNILYRFPSLQRTASSKRSGRKEYVGKKWAEWVGGIDKYFRERKWDFSKAGSSERALVIGLGGLNLFGVIILGAMLKDMAVTHGGLITFVMAYFLYFRYMLVHINKGLSKENRLRFLHCDLNRQSRKASNVMLLLGKVVEYAVNLTGIFHRSRPIGFYNSSYSENDDEECFLKISSNENDLGRSSDLGIDNVGYEDLSRYMIAMVKFMSQKFLDSWNASVQNLKFPKENQRRLCLSLCF